MSPLKRGAGHARDPQTGPWITASFTGGECVRCHEDLVEGERICADGDGGWLCSYCGEEIKGRQGG